MDKSNKTYKPTLAMLNNSLRGSVLLEKSSSAASLNIKPKVQPLVDILKKSEITLGEVKALYTFLNKAQNTYRPDERQEGNTLTAESAAYIAAGGSSALAFSRMVLKEEGILKSYSKDIAKEDLDKEEELTNIKLPISKAVNEELMQVTFIAMLPDEVDLHGDITSVDEVRKACHNFNKFCMKANLFHAVETTTFEIAESYILPCDIILSDKLVKAGTWLVNLQVLDDGLWQLIKSGEVNGVSIGALAKVEVLEEDD